MSRQHYCNIPVIYTKKSADHNTAMRQWLVENVDPECYDAEDWRAVDHNWNQRRIWFSHEQDAVIFALRWS
jgi:hypothetical protein